MRICSGTAAEAPPDSASSSHNSSPLLGRRLGPSPPSPPAPPAVVLKGASVASYGKRRMLVSVCGGGVHFLGDSVGYNDDKDQNDDDDDDDDDDDFDASAESTAEVSP